MTQLNLQNLKARVDELGELDNGWLDGEGEPLDPQGLVRISDALQELYEQSGIPIPYIYPTPDGNVQAEWTIGSWELNTVIDLASGKADVVAVNIDTNADAEAKINIYSPNGRIAFVQLISSLQ